jgi:hypothetical protein
LQIYTSSERRVVASAEIFAAALFDVQNQSNGISASSTPNSQSSRSSFEGNRNNGFSNNQNHSKSQSILSTSSSKAIDLIIRKDLLDDSNAAKDLMDDVKKRLKILLRPGEPEKRPELTWPKSMKKEPVEVVKVIKIRTDLSHFSHR